MYTHFHLYQVNRLQGCNMLHVNAPSLVFQTHHFPKWRFRQTKTQQPAWGTVADGSDSTQTAMVRRGQLQD